MKLSGPSGRRVIAVLAIVALLASAAVYLLAPGDDRGVGPALDMALSDPACDPAKRACKAVAGDTTAELELGPPVAVMQPMPVSLRIQSAEAGEARDVRVRFDMEGMDMGRNEYQLAETGAGRWTGSAILPVCSSGRRDWIATVRFTLAGEDYRARFPFRAGPPGAQ